MPVVGQGDSENVPTPTYHPPARRRRPPTPQPAPVSYPVPTSTGQYSRPPQAPPIEAPGAIATIQRPPSIQSFLGHDTTYRDQLRQFARAMSDFTGEQTTQRSRLKQDYATNRRSMNEQKVRDLEGMEEDFASRGLISSGLYGEEVGKYNTSFLERLAELTKGRDRSLAGFEQELARFRREQELARQAAREAAVRRRAEEYGLG